MQLITAGMAALRQFFSFTERNKIQALLIIALTITGMGFKAVSVKALEIMDRGYVRIEDDNKRVRQENKELKAENKDLIIENTELLRKPTAVQDSVTSILKRINQKLQK